MDDDDLRELRDRVIRLEGLASQADRSIEDARLHMAKEVVAVESRSMERIKNLEANQRWFSLAIIGAFVSSLVSAMGWKP